MATSGHPNRVGRSTSRTSRRLLQFELLGQRRVLATITGHVFNDLNDSFHREESEVGLAHRVVYLDVNDNQQVDIGEPVQLTNETGAYAFEDLAAGEYVVRLFNGTATQVQNTPFQADSLPDIAVVDPLQDDPLSYVGFEGTGDRFSYTAAGNTLTQVELDTAASSSIELPGDVVDFNLLGDRRVIALLRSNADHPSTDAVVLVSFLDNSVTALGQSQSSAVPSSRQLALTDSGSGLLVPAAEAGVSVPLHAVEFDRSTLAWSNEATTLNVDATAKLWTTAGSPLVLVSQPSGNGTQVALWSTVSKSVVAGSDHILQDISEILAFDDQTGLLVARDTSGSVHIFDAANNYAQLVVLDSLRGPVALDGHRELLYGIAEGSNLEIFDIAQQELLTQLPLALEAGGVAGLALSDNGKRIAIRRPAAVSQFRIDRPGGHRVELQADETSKDLLFGLLVDGENDPPAFNAPPELTVLEDHTINMNAPGIAAGLPNPEGDHYLTLQLSQAANGQVVVRPGGALTYVPNANFNGTDSFQILVSDGRDDTGPVTVTVNVTPVDDPLGQIGLEVLGFPETIQGPAVIGHFEIEAFDGEELFIVLSDPRFAISGNEVLVVEGAEFDYENQMVIRLQVDVYNQDNFYESASSVTLIPVIDVDEPPTDIVPHEVTVAENLTGVVLANLTVIDPDYIKPYTLVTSDDRFTIEDNVLKLVAENGLDFEAGNPIAVPIRALDADGNEIYSQEIQVNVSDVDEPITDLTLSNQTLPELAAGYTVGAVTVVDPDTNESHDLSVDDPRFEVVDAQLKLRHGVYVRFADQAEILVTVTASPQQGSAFSKDFVLTVSENPRPWNNTEEPTDVDGNGETSPIDALIIINYLNREGPGNLIDPITYEGSQPPRFYDVNGDGMVTPLDALIIINYLNRQGLPSAEPEGGSAETAPPTSSSAEAGRSTTIVPPPADTYFGQLEDDDDDDDELALR